MITIANIYKAIKGQMPLKRFCKNLMNGRLNGLISKRSHLRENGESKIPFSTEKKARKASERMQRKNGYHFSVYKCLYCDGWHIGADRYKMNREIDNGS